MSCDADFGCVERMVRKAESVFLPIEYIRIMKTCNQKKPFDVTIMKSEDFFSVATILKFVTKRKIDSSSKEQVSWLKTHQITLKKDQEFCFFLKYDLRSDKVRVFDFFFKTEFFLN